METQVRANRCCALLDEQLSVLENASSVSCGRLNPYVTFVVCDLGYAGVTQW